MNGYSIGMTFMVSNKVFPKRHLTQSDKQRHGIRHLVDYLLDIKELDYVLLGFILSDYLEPRFGWYRQLCGANYFNSVLQLLQAEKSIRIRSLLDMNFNIDSIKEIFHE